MSINHISDNQITSPKKHRTTSVVLGSGGMRSLAEMPLLEYLVGKSVPIDMIYATGGGAALAALFASGYSFGEIPSLMARIFDRNLYNQFDYGMVLKILGFRRKPFTSPPAPYKSQPCLDVLKEIFGDRRIEDLPQKLTIQVTEMSTGRETSITKGLLAEWVYASNATYPFLPPLAYDGKYYASGVFTATIPALQAVQGNYDIIFIVSVNDTIPISAKGMFEYINTFFMRSCTSTQGRQLALAISLHEGEAVLLNVPFDKAINLWDSNAANEILSYGKKMIENRREDIDEAISLVFTNK